MNLGAAEMAHLKPRGKERLQQRVAGTKRSKTARTKAESPQPRESSASSGVLQLLVWGQKSPLQGPHS